MLEPFGMLVEIAGGALYDLLDGKSSFKDIDVYVHNSSIAQVARYCPLDFEQEHTRVDEEAQEYLNSNSRIHGVYDTEFEGYKVQLIGYTPGGMTPLEGFDFGICKVGYTLRDGLYQSSQRHLDLSQRTLTLYQINSFHQFSKISSRLDKLLYKYPDFTPVVSNRAINFGVE